MWRKPAFITLLLDLFRMENSFKKRHLNGTQRHIFLRALYVIRASTFSGFKFKSLKLKLNALCVHNEILVYWNRPFRVDGKFFLYYIVRWIMYLLEIDGVMSKYREKVCNLNTNKSFSHYIKKTEHNFWYHKKSGFFAALKTLH